MTGRTTPDLRKGYRVARMAASLWLRSRRPASIGTDGCREPGGRMARLKQRMWRYGAVIAPVVALALSLEAGRRWF